jgi:hypothetical protein
MENAAAYVEFFETKGAGVKYFVLSVCSFYQKPTQWQYWHKAF